MERLIDKETAILAKKMNYLWDCDYYYMENSRTLFHCHRAVNNNVLGDMKYAAPLQSSLQKWLREKHHIHVMIRVDDLGWWWQLYDSSANGRLKEYNQITESYAGKKTYEEAMEEGLFKALEILKTIQEEKPVMNFTTPCFIRKNNTELRSKLRELGYTVLLDIFDSPCLTTTSCGFAMPSPELNKYGAYDCGENENLFLALAGMRDDTDEKQYFVYSESFHVIRAGIYYPKGSLVYIKQGTADHSLMRKATKEEIIEHFK